MSYKVLRVTLRAMVIAALALAAGTAWAQVRYEYTGPKFSQATFPFYTQDQRIEGWLEFNEPLGPYLSDADISNLLVDFSFTDGVQERLPGNSTVCAITASTNGSGQVNHIAIELREKPLPPAGADQQFLEIHVDRVGEVEAGDTVCAFPDNPPNELASNYSELGVWTNPEEVAPQPTIYSYRGQPFSSVDIPNDPGDAINGTMTVDGPLPGSRIAFDVTPYVTSFSFSDGQDDFNDQQGKLCFAYVDTDVWGRIRGWEIIASLHSGSSSQQRVIQMQGGFLANPGPGDVVMSGNSTAAPCGVNASTESSIDDPGSWSSELDPPDEPTEYRYRREPYDDVSGAGEAGDRGWSYVDFDHPLPANLELEALHDAYAEYGDFRFLDSLQYRTAENTTVCEFRVSTNGDGEITQWRVRVREAPTPGAGEPQKAFEISHDGTNSSHIGLTDADPTACEPLNVTDYQRTDNAGTWQVPDPIHGDRFEEKSQ